MSCCWRLTFSFLSSQTKNKTQPPLVQFSHRICGTTLERKACSWTNAAWYAPPPASSLLTSCCCPKHTDCCLLTLLLGSKGTRNTWTESLNLRKTPLSFPETGELDVFICTSTPWPKGNHPKMENNVLEVPKMCFHSRDTKNRHEERDLCCEEAL